MPTLACEFIARPVFVFARIRGSPCGNLDIARWGFDWSKLGCADRDGDGEGWYDAGSCDEGALWGKVDRRVRISEVTGYENHR